MNRLPVAPLLAASLLLAARAVCAAPAPAESPAPAAATPAARAAPATKASASFKAALGALGSHEECRHLEAGAKRNYHWRTTAPVDFNIHYHHGDDVTYALKRAAMRGDGGTFIAPATADYCWMWTALNRPAKLDGGIKQSGSGSH